MSGCRKRVWGSFSRSRELTLTFSSAPCAAWLVCDDFLLAALPAELDVVVGNPLYLRQERIPAHRFPLDRYDLAARHCHAGKEAHVA
jgi:hypothetical protein